MLITEKKEVLSSVDTLNIGDCTVLKTSRFSAVDFRQLCTV